MLGTLALVLVAAGLGTTARAQIRPLGRYRVLLDLLGIVPEWRFFAPASARHAGDLATDTHLIVRDRGDDGRTTAWRPLLWHAERRSYHALWNAQRRADELILSIAEDLAQAWAEAPAEGVQQSIPYLILLRRSLATPDGNGAIDRQFAIVRTLGRAPRSLSIGFVSAWHRR